MNPIFNRLEKNYKKLKSWAEKYKLDAFRIYEKDIPDYPFIVDKYKDHLIVFDRRDPKIDSDIKKSKHFEELMHGLTELFKVSEKNIFIKARQRQKGLNQYEKLANDQTRLTIQEGPAFFIVNLSDYLDTGLFLDHRILREKILKISKDKSVLNLFSYTCSISVFAALGGAEVTSVDMSNTYLEWGKENFNLNGLSPHQHRFIQENALSFLENDQNLYDIVVCDPPTFSNSKRMTDFFEVEKDQEFLIENCMRLTRPNGVFFFSNNKRDFKLSDKMAEKFKIKDISLSTIPNDFSDKKIHKVYEIRHKSQ